MRNIKFRRSLAQAGRAREITNVKVWAVGCAVVGLVVLMLVALSTSNASRASAATPECPGCTPRAYLPLILRPLVPLTCQHEMQDEEENNDVPASANPLPMCRHMRGSIWPTGDVDWFKLDAPAAGEMYLRLQAPAGVDYDLSLYPQSADYPLAQSSTPGNAIEQITYTLPVSGAYYVLVAPFNGASEQVYTLDYAMSPYILGQ